MTSTSTEQASPEPTADHWDAVYTEKSPAEVSWFQRTPSTSLELIGALEPRPTSIVDVGAGASTLVDRLLASGLTDVSVLDVSERALRVVRERLGEQASQVTFVVADVRAFVAGRTYDLWHDRAVFHFLTEPADQERYVQAATRAVAPGGALVLGCFAPDGPTQCSGLDTLRLGPDELAARFVPHFTLERAEREVHHTPWEAEQAFTWVVLRRTASA